MSEPKLISPLLDGFAMGAPMSNHHGVCCCPAMKENSDNKYIVKVISIPASQTQLDALLLTGAYKDPAAAMDYFKELSDGVIAEAEILQKLSKLEGFLPFDSWQVVPMENNQLGYDVYLVTSYKRSLEKFMRRNPMTHLGAVNLGLDMCAALAICRSAGYLYVDLQPSNIFISEDKEYRIGDLGFVPLSSLKYASLPSKYRSIYTPPELHDAMATLNTTMDIYAAGLILYQIYNNGSLPFMGKAPAEPLPTPLNADYEIAEIILKACAPDPKDRWQDPMEMGQALVAYMQRNVINDVPINPPKAEILMEAPLGEEPSPEAIPESMPILEPQATDEAVPMDNAGEDPADVNSEAAADGSPEENEDEDAAASGLADDTAGNTMEDDRKTMILQTPVAPKKRRLVIFDDEDDEDDYEDDDEDLDEDDDSFDPQPKPKKKRTGLIVALILILLLAALGVGAYYFYNNYYILEINSISVDGAQNSMVVTIETDIDTSLLTVVCSDSYGNTKRTTITDGKATFNDLTPDTMYQIQLEVEGFHQLVGPDYSSYTTAAETKILNFSGITGNEDGSVVLSFTVEGPEKEWNLIASAEGEEDRVVSFSGHTVTVTGLTIGKTYTLTLAEPSDSLYIVGSNTLEFTASSIILAQNLEITSCAGSTLSAAWEISEGTTVESWNVLCYGDDGSTLSTTTTETNVTFEGINTSTGYTVEVTAAGMTQAVRTNVTANPITIGDITVDESNLERLTVQWDFAGSTPEGGWLLMYYLDNSETPTVVSCDTNSAIIVPRIPGAAYTLVIHAADGTTVFNETHTYDCPDAPDFARYDLYARNVRANTLVTPTKENWSYKDVSNNNYTDTFTSGQKISLILRAVTDFYIPRDQTSILYVIRDSEGNVLPELVDYSDSYTWYHMWVNTNYHYCELDIPKIPTTAGSYTLDLYFNGYAICSVNFTITE